MKTVFNLKNKKLANVATAYSPLKSFDDKIKKGKQNNGVYQKSLITFCIAGAFCLAGGLALDGSYEKLNNDFHGFTKSQKQIIELAERYNADMQLSSKNFYLGHSILKSNGNYPIWVNIDESLKSKCGNQIEQAFKIWEQWMQPINDEYKFEFVNQNQLLEAQKVFQSTISVVDENLEIEGGTLFGTSGSVGLFDIALSRVTNKSFIKINSKSMENDKKRLLHVVVHEIGHSMGLDDVYENCFTRDHTTFMGDSSFPERLLMLSENDVKVLVAKYAKEYITNPQNQKKELERLDKYINDYSKFVKMEIIKEAIKKISATGDSLQKIDIDKLKDVNFSSFWNEVNFDKNKEEYDFIFCNENFKLNNNEFNLVVNGKSKDGKTVIAPQNYSGTTEIDDFFVQIYGYPFSLNSDVVKKPKNYVFIVKIDNEFKLMIIDSFARIFKENNLSLNQDFANC
ncbi:MAG: hypothetical protein RR140_03560 [Clostridia bacterium]